jgi:hypothetical protein
MDWGGFGIRKHIPSMDTGYVPRKGPGLRVTIRLADGKVVTDTFICNDPDAVIAALAPTA